jgi:hypothetical protein
MVHVILCNETGYSFQHVSLQCITEVLRLPALISKQIWETLCHLNKITQLTIDLSIISRLVSRSCFKTVERPVHLSCIYQVTGVNSTNAPHPADDRVICLILISPMLT